MQKLYTFFIAIIVSANVFGQVPNWAWARSAGGTGSDVSWNCTIDLNGNVIVAGGFRSSSILLGSTTLTNPNPGNWDYFLAKFDSNGNVIWAKSGGGTDYDYAKSCTTDSYGNIIITGYFDSPDFMVETTSLVTSGLIDIFIIKYDPSGNLIWALNEGDSGNDYSLDCKSDSLGNFWITGYFDSPSLSISGFTFNNSGITDAFLAKYDSNGNIIWAKKAGGIGTDGSTKCAIDNSGNVIITGNYYGQTINFGNQSLTNTSNTGANDIFIAKYDPLGNFLWVKTATSVGSEFINGCTIDVNGNIIITGSFNAISISFGALVLTNFSITDNDIFITKYSQSGNPLWTKSIGGIGNDAGRSCTTDVNGNIIIASAFSSPSISLGSNIVNNTNSSTTDILITEFDSIGNLLWTKSTGGIGQDNVLGCSISSNGSIYITGSFLSPSLTFGNVTLANADITGSNADMFLAKLAAITVGIEENNLGNNYVTIYPNPSKDKLYINCNSNYSSIQMYDLVGNEMQPQINKSDLKINGTFNFELSTLHLNSGIYFIKVTDSNGRTEVSKVVKE